MLLNINNTDIFSIQFRHVRNYKFNGEINPYGGTTVLAAVSAKSALPRIYYSRCHNNDHYNKHIGIMFCIQELIWDLVAPNQILGFLSPVDGGKTFNVITTKCSSVDPVGEFTSTLARLVISTK